jgi:hypothetical protein
MGAVFAVAVATVAANGVAVGNVVAIWATVKVAPTLMLQCHCFGAVVTVGSS